MASSVICSGNFLRPSAVQDAGLQMHCPDVEWHRSYNSHTFNFAVTGALRLTSNVSLPENQFSSGRKSTAPFAVNSVARDGAGQEVSLGTRLPREIVVRPRNFSSLRQLVFR